MNICLLRLVLDGGNANESTENILALFCKYKSSEYKMVGIFHCERT